MLIIDVIAVVTILAVLTIIGVLVYFLRRKVDPTIQGTQNLAEAERLNKQRCHFCRKICDVMHDFFAYNRWYCAACYNHEFTVTKNAKHQEESKK